MRDRFIAACRPSARRKPGPWATGRLGRSLGLCLFVAAAVRADGVEAQDAHLQLLRAGQVRASVPGVFRSASERFGYRVEGGTAIEETEPLAFDLQLENGARLFAGVDILQSSVASLTGDGSYLPTLGPTASYMQASQVQVPFQLELGLTDWLTLGVTVPLVQSRTEGEIGILPATSANLGINPAVTDPAGTLAFAEQVRAAALALPAALQDTWLPWASAWADAYGASAVFPLAGTAGGDALASSVADFNAVLAANGVPQVPALPPLAAEAMDAVAFRTLLSQPGGPLSYLSLPNALLWTLGDVEAELRLRLLEGPVLASTGRPSGGVTALGRVRLPTGSGEDVIALLDIPAGSGLFGFDAGLGGWIRNERFGISGWGTYGQTLPGTVTRRVAPPDVVLAPSGAVAQVERDPGDRIRLEVRPSVAMAAPLWIEGFYRYEYQGADTFSGSLPWDVATDLSSSLQAPGPRYPASVLGQETETTVHLAGGGLRFQPPAGDFPVEAWVNVVTAVSGSGGQTLKETRLSFGARLTRRLWGRD